MNGVIDIGTNSVLLLVAAREDSAVRAVEEGLAVTRLGEGLAANGAISAEAAERTLAALREFRGRCQALGAKEIAAIGTAAFRRASNAGDFIARARAELGIDIEVISSEREAGLAHAASAHDFGADIVVLDIGGGSTEFIGRDARGALSSASLAIGSVNLTEDFLASDPPTREELFHLRRHIRAALEEGLDPTLFARPHDRTLVATAGTATTLAAMRLRLPSYDPARVHGSAITIEDLRDLIDAMRPLQLAERRRLPGLMPKRADVILAGAELLQEAMSFLGFARATISDRGVRWGLFYERFCHQDSTGAR